MNVLWTVISILAYIGGLVIILRATPQLLLRSYDEGLFMGIAALDIVGALLAFGAVTLTYSIFSGTLGIKVLDFIFLLGLLAVALREAFLCLRPPRMEALLVSRIITGCYSLFLALAACYFLGLLFVSR